MKIYSICRNNKPFVRTYDAERARTLLDMHDRKYGRGEFQLVISDDDAPFYYRDAPTEDEYRAAYEATIDADFDLYEESRDPGTL